MSSWMRRPTTNCSKECVSLANQVPAKAALLSGGRSRHLVPACHANVRTCSIGDRAGADLAVRPATLGCSPRVCGPVFAGEGSGSTLGIGACQVAWSLRPCHVAKA